MAWTLRHVITLATVAVAGAALPVLATLTPATATTDWTVTRLVDNSGFEDPEGLTPWQPDTTGGTVTVVTSGHDSSGHALRVCRTLTRPSRCLPAAGGSLSCPGRS